MFENSNKALVLGQDLNEEGTDIGPRTVLRLREAFSHYQRTGEVLVVAAGFSPRHKNQKVTMAQMMAEYLWSLGECKVLVLEARLFNTRGELEAFFLLEGARTIISAPWHLRRVRIMIDQEFGRGRLETLRFVAVEKNVMTFKERFFLEPLKCLFVRFVPNDKRDKLWYKATFISKKMGINISY